MNKIKLTRVFSALLVSTLLITATGCSQKDMADNLMKGITTTSVAQIDSYVEDDNLAAFDFSFRLFKQNLLCQNTLISPVSMLYALGMTSNGARENTLAQMEEVFGLPRENINQMLNLYIRNLPDEDKLKINVANSIWFKEDGSLDVNGDFLQTNANYYSSEIYQSPFDNTTLESINNWVDHQTDGMIENIIDEIPEEAVMYLINALSFDAEWDTIYMKNAIKEDFFNADDGTLQEAEMMYSKENLYIEDGEAKGFMKNYADGKYAFVAILPPEDLHLCAYIASLSSEKLQGLIENAKDTEINTMMPKFTTEYSVEMSDILKMMGMEDAFDQNKADLKDLGTADGNLYIGRVIHKTKIEVDEKGTKAGAAAMVEIDKESAALEEPKIVYLDRPFMYLIIDTESYLPLFIGTTLYVK